MNSETNYKETLDLEGDTLKLIFGECDRYIQKLENDLAVTITNRDGLLISGDESSVKKARRLLLDLVEISKREESLEAHKVEYGISLVKEGNEDALLKLEEDVICHAINGKPVKPKTVGQKAYTDAIRDHMITFGTGPAGTGKTYLAMAMAITAFKKEEVNRIILTRPAIEAGEKLGFLPGDLQSKVDPYLRPLYDALYQIMGAESFSKNMEKGLIEVAPLAYMRGRTLDNSFIILDEAQNTTPAQMKMFLTRIGFGSKAVITGDLTQKDLMPGSLSGLDEAIRVLGKVEEIRFCTLTSKDVVRHPLVMKIVQEYEKYEKSKIRYDNKKRKRT
ncbi:MAG TPA: PhoH family protein [Lachnospiraceae bacterium]|nr:PhoH family protein [Lachnospiraceae bacterium]HPF29374.1 PhoH family protein [Lachnospiraceae bacterium]